MELTSEPPTEVEKKIGHYIADLIEDGSTIQLGIGGIPNAITADIMERKDLGIHTEMLVDGMVDLMEAGVVNNRKKTLHPGKSIGAFALGTSKLYKFINRNKDVELYRGRYTNDPYIVAQNYKMISVNTALQVDILGQVCSQSIGTRQFSGTGGQLDTHRGAQMSPGGAASLRCDQRQMAAFQQLFQHWHPGWRDRSQPGRGYDHHRIWCCRIKRTDC